MGVSRKDRFEVFKRDGFKCAYCGRTPPQVVLEADHIEPKSEGGKDHISNLITACFDCNRGKRDHPLTSIPSPLAENIANVKEKCEQLEEYKKYTRKIERLIKKDVDEISAVYEEAYEGWQFSNTFKQVTLKTFLKKLSKEEIIESLYIAINKYPDDSTRVIKYFCGVCWSKIKREQEKYHGQD